MSYITYSEYPEWETQPSHWAGVYVHTYIHIHILWWRIHIELSAQQPIMSWYCINAVFSPQTCRKHFIWYGCNTSSRQYHLALRRSLRQESVCWRSAFRDWSR